MTNERFNELLNGPLSHPILPMRLNRMALALMHVVQGCGPQADKILEDYCAARQKQDEENVRAVEMGEWNGEAQEDEDIPY